MPGSTGIDLFSICPQSKDSHGARYRQQVAEITRWSEEVSLAAADLSVFNPAIAVGPAGPRQPPKQDAALCCRAVRRWHRRVRPVLRHHRPADRRGGSPAREPADAFLAPALSDFNFMLGVRPQARVHLVDHRNGVRLDRERLHVAAVGWRHPPLRRLSYIPVDRAPQNCPSRARARRRDRRRGHRQLHEPGGPGLGKPDRSSARNASNGVGRKVKA